MIMIDMKRGFIREGELVAQRIHMWYVNGHRVAIWSIQDTELHNVKYVLVNTQTGRIIESLSLDHLERLYDMCIQRFYDARG